MIPKIARVPTLQCHVLKACLSGDIKGKKIAIPKEYRMDGMLAEIEKLWSAGADMLRERGLKIVDVSLPHTKYALPALLCDCTGRSLLQPCSL